MKRKIDMKRIFLLMLLLVPCLVSAQKKDLNYDWAKFYRYAEANEQLTTAPYVVFMGDSIFDGWIKKQPEYFNDNNFADRGISGQTTSHMLVRFRTDVLALNPKAVVILAGTNDIALNNGYIKPEHIANNIISMIELAQGAGIRPILCSVLPAGKYRWRPEVEDVPGKIRELNALLEAYARENKIDWVDFHPAMALADGSMNTAYTNDYVHPTADGYTKMQEVLYPYLKKYIQKAQKTK